MLYLVRNKIVRANNPQDARRVAGHPDWPICGIITLNPDGPNGVIIDLDDCKITEDYSNDPWAKEDLLPELFTDEDLLQSEDCSNKPDYPGYPDHFLTED